MSGAIVVRIYYTTEETILKEEYFQINYKKEGVYKSYYPNGNLYKIGNYVDDKLEGECKEYYQNGKLKSICNFIIFIYIFYVI
jgi:antitoxin component YwqK of YwqJK toxin-antitoxin module